MRSFYKILSFVGAMLLSPAPVFAAPPVNPTAGWGGCIVKGAATIQCFELLFASIVRFIVMFAGIVLFIVLVTGGFKLLISSGDAKKLEMAKKTITTGILGLVIIVSAYLILKTIEVLTGVPVTVFTIPAAAP